MLIIATSCDDRPKRVPVAGQVLIDGEPLTMGSVTLIPQGARPSRGEIGPDGRFVLTCYDKDDGVIPGTHRVAVSSKESIGDTAFKWFAPKKYSNVTTSGLEVTVSEENPDLKIELTWDGGKPYVEGRKSKSDAGEGEDF